MKRNVLTSILLAIGVTMSALTIRHTSTSIRPGNIPQNIDTLILSKNVRSIAPEALADHPKLRCVFVEKGSALSSIGEYAFMGCSQLQHIDLPASLSSIGDACFRECSALQSVEIPPKISQIPSFAFAYCSSLEHISLPQALRSIGRNAFYECSGLKLIELPHSLKSIGMNAFSDCSQLAEIHFPASVSSLGSYVCSGCAQLREVTLPANPSMLGELMLTGCRNLQIINEMSTIPPSFECNSTLFDPEEAKLIYPHLSVNVPSRSLIDYSNAPGWAPIFHK